MSIRWRGFAGAVRFRCRAIAPALPAKLPSMLRSRLRMARKSCRIPRTSGCSEAGTRCSKVNRRLPTSSCKSEVVDTLTFGIQRLCQCELLLQWRTGQGWAWMPRCYRVSTNPVAPSCMTFSSVRCVVFVQVITIVEYPCGSAGQAAAAQRHQDAVHGGQVHQPWRDYGQRPAAITSSPAALRSGPRCRRWPMRCPAHVRDTITGKVPSPKVAMVSARRAPR